MKDSTFNWIHSHNYFVSIENNADFGYVLWIFQATPITGSTLATKKRKEEKLSLNRNMSLLPKTLCNWSLFITNK
jgi:hypothetical protein